MGRLLYGCLSLAFSVSPVVAQAEQPAESSGGAQPWAFAILFTLIILLIVCMPSRKSQT